MLSEVLMSRQSLIPGLMNHVFTPNQVSSPRFLSQSQNDLLSMTFSQRAKKCD